jgi:hypothetical protein
MAPDSADDDADNEKMKDISFSVRGKGKTPQLDVKRVHKESVTLDNYFGEFN